MLFEEHWKDASGNPAGGVSQDVGFTISWQNGPLAVDGVRREPNGAFVENVIRAVIGRLEFYQSSRFACQYNADAIHHLNAALERLQARTADRVARKVEGTHGE